MSTRSTEIIQGVAAGVAAPVSMSDGASVTDGSTTDAAVIGDSSGSDSAKLRGINLELDSIRVNMVRMAYAQSALLAKQLSMQMIQTGGFIPIVQVPEFLGGF
jgi:hypothetical protein